MTVKTGSVTGGSGNLTNGHGGFVIGGSIYEFLTEAGDGTGAIDAIGNYATPTKWFYKNSSADEVDDIHRMIVTVADSGGFDTGRYGNGLILTNGIKIFHYAADGTTIIEDLTHTNAIEINVDWGSYCYDISYNAWGTGDNVLLVRWTFANAGQPIRLAPGEELAIVLQDDFTGLSEHRFHIQGYRYLLH